MGIKMMNIIIKNKNTEEIIFKGIYNNDKECIEDAISKGVNLSRADLRRRNFQSANIDTAQLDGADLRFSNLSNANISESNLAGADLRGANLIGTCLAETNLTSALLQNASFGATDIAYATLDGVQLSTLSALHLPFIEAASMQLCVFQTANTDIITFSTPPILIQGLLNKNLYIIENNILFGHDNVSPPLQDALNNKSAILSMLAQRYTKFDRTLQKGYVKHNN